MLDYFKQLLQTLAIADVIGTLILAISICCVLVSGKKREAEDHSRIHEWNIVAHSSAPCRLPCRLFTFSSAKRLMHKLFLSLCSKDQR